MPRNEHLPTPEQVNPCSPHVVSGTLNELAPAAPTLSAYRSVPLATSPTVTPNPASISMCGTAMLYGVNPAPNGILESAALLFLRLIMLLNFFLLVRYRARVRVEGGCARQ